MDKNDMIYEQYETEHKEVKSTIKSLKIYRGLYTTVLAADITMGVICLHNNLELFSACFALSTILVAHEIKGYNKEIKYNRIRDEKLKEYEESGPEVMRDGLLKLDIWRSVQRYTWMSDEEKQRKVQARIEELAQLEKEENEDEIDLETVESVILTQNLEAPDEAVDMVEDTHTYKR